MQNKIIITGARTHNLKNVSLEIPRDKLVVFTGLSGSGKSSLAFDTIFAEGQRRYVESLSSYARQFLGLMEKPDVDSIEGLSPAVSIDQKTTSNNPRSTVGTVTEIYDYLRLLWARIGIPHCPVCGKEIKRQSLDQIVDQVMQLEEGTRIMIMAPVVRHKKGEHVKVLEEARKSGFVRVCIDNELFDLSEEIKLKKNNHHNIEIIIDRLVIKKDILRRLTDSIETALNLADGIVYINLPQQNKNLIFSQNYACDDCGISIEELNPRLFSFNSPNGACKTCSGIGSLLHIDPGMIIPNPSLSILDGGIVASGWGNIRSDSIARMYFEALAKKYKFSLNDPISSIPQDGLNAILYGTGDEKLKMRYERANGYGILEKPFEGIVNNLQRRYEESQSQSMKDDIENSMSEYECPDCKGKRLKDAVLAVTVGGISISDFTSLSIKQAITFLDELVLTPKEEAIASRILKEITARLNFLLNVGLGYLTLSRSAGSLSGGESQRIRLATQIGTGLTGVLYILDEPSIGLHQRDNEKLLNTLKTLRDNGNSLIVVEHDEDTIRNADYIVDIGPEAGIHGGELVFCGSAEEILKCDASVTGRYLSGKSRIDIPHNRRKGNGSFLTIKGASENNLKFIDVDFPCGTFICVTGVSGSGKSTLVNEILYKSLLSELNRVKIRPGKSSGVLGIDNVDKVIQIDQSPIGRTPRSNPATYTGVFNLIRDLFSSVEEARVRGYKPSRFSFNVKGGRCEACSGDGMVKIEMHFLPDVYVPCEVCNGKRYNRETLEVFYKGKNISDVLNMTVEEAIPFFQNQEHILEKIKTLYAVGLGYIKLGQPSTTLSGGEAQRIKLASELSRKSTGKTLYILDEPTTGLHTADVSKLIEILQKLTDTGNTIIVIEHNMELIKCADYIIDLGPDGGDNGGNVVFSGTPEQCALCESSYTGLYLKKYLNV